MKKPWQCVTETVVESQPQWFWAVSECAVTVKKDWAVLFGGVSGSEKEHLVTEKVRAFYMF